MKAMGLAAVAALLAASRMADAHPAETQGANEAVRAADEARALVARMQTNADHALEARRKARAMRVPEALACTNEALSRADVALRRAREDLSRLSAAWSDGDVGSARAALLTIRSRATASQEAAARASWCVQPEVRVSGEKTRVTMQVDPSIVPFEPDFPPVLHR